MRVLKLPPQFHGANVTSLDVLQDRLLAGTADGSLFLWDINQLTSIASLENPTFEDIQSLKPLFKLNVHQGSNVTSVMFFDLTHCLSSDSDGQIIMTDLQTKSTEILLSHNVEINDLQLMENFVIAATLNKVFMINIFVKEMVSSIPVKSDVKCVSLDPTKNYLLVIGFNKTCTMFQLQVIDGKLFYKKMKNPQESLSTINDITKASWSHIGDKYALPNTPTSDKTRTSTVAIYNRNDFKLEYQLVGPDANIVKFSPKLYKMEGRLTNFIALAGIDKSLSVWNSCFQRPLFTAKDLTTSKVSDIIWAEDGQTLFTAADTLIVFAFLESDLGEKANVGEIANIMRTLDYPESFNVDELKDQFQQYQLLSSQERKPTHKPRDNEQSAPIQPKPQPKPAKSVSSSVTSKPQSEQPKLIDSPEIRSSSLLRKVETPKSQPSTPNVKSTPKSVLSFNNNDVKLQTASIKDGKKRVAPTLISGIGNCKPSKTQKTAEPEITESSRLMDFQQPSYSVPRDLKRREEFKDGPDAQVKKKRDLEIVEFIGSIVINPSTSFSKLRVSTPKIRASFLHISPIDESTSLEVTNGSGNVEKPTKISVIKGSNRFIFDYVPKLVGLATGGEGKFWAVSTIDGVLYVYSNSGRKLLPAMTLGTPISFLESKGPYLMAVTSLGEVYVWNVLNKKVHFPPTSLYSILSRSNPDLLTRAENLTLVSLSSNGIPVVTISNGTGYIYDPDMEVWNVVSDTWWAFGSQFWDGGRASIIHGNKEQNIVSVVESKTNDEILRKGRGKFLQQISRTMLMKEGYENLEKVISLTHLENKILISAKLGNANDFKAQLLVYCKRVSEMGLRSKLLEVFQELYNERKGSKEDGDIKRLGFEKRELLKEIIFNCASIRSVQRILMEYATLLGIVDQIVL